MNLERQKISSEVEENHKPLADPYFYEVKTKLY